MSVEDIRFSRPYTAGDHLYRREGEVIEIVFENGRTGLRKTVVDNNGLITDFPGIAHPDLVSQFCAGTLGNRIRYSSCFQLLDGQYALIWQIQPDGRYWEDEDGYGCTPDEKIDLYARIDETGRFTEPFRIYSIGKSRFYGTDEEEALARRLAAPGDPLTYLREHVPEMLGRMRELIEVPETGEASCFIPGTLYQARLLLRCDQGFWFVRADISRERTDTGEVGWLRAFPLDGQREYLNSEAATEEAEKSSKSCLRSSGARNEAALRKEVLHERQASSPSSPGRRVRRIRAT